MGYEKECFTGKIHLPKHTQHHSCSATLQSLQLIPLPARTLLSVASEPLE